MWCRYVGVGVAVMEVILQLRWPIAFVLSALIAGLIGAVAKQFASPFPRVMNVGDWTAAACGLLFVFSLLAFAISAIWVLFV